MSIAYDAELFETATAAAPLTARGHVVFVKLRKDREQRSWVCDECFNVVRPSRQEDHARRHR